MKSSSIFLSLVLVGAPRWWACLAFTSPFWLVRSMPQHRDHHHHHVLLARSRHPLSRALLAVQNGGGMEDDNTNANNSQRRGTAGAASKSPLHALSVTELKQLLSDRGVDFRDCLEKSELVDRLVESQVNNIHKNKKQSSHSQSSTSSSFSGALPPLTAHEQNTIATFKRSSPSVAYIQTLRSTTATTQQRGMTFKGTEVPAGTGSGFLWDEQGHIVTNYHVLTGGKSKSTLPSRVTVKLTGLPDARDADIVGVEPEKDLAVLKLRNTSHLPPPLLVGTSHDLQVGQSVLTIGNPYGLDDTLTTGVVSALGRDIDGIGGRPIHSMIQTDAPINPGNSGGPLLDSRGRLIGVNTAIFSPNGVGNVGIGFAIPVDTVRRVVNQIVRFGKTVRPTLGINVVDDRVTQHISNQLGRSLDGVLIAEVLPNSPAVVAGLEASQWRSDGSVVLGDLIARVDGEPVKQTEDLISAIETRNEGDVVELVVWRKADPRRVQRVRARLTTRDKLLSTENNMVNQRSSTASRNKGSSNIRRTSDAWQ